MAWNLYSKAWYKKFSWEKELFLFVLYKKTQKSKKKIT